MNNEFYFCYLGLSFLPVREDRQKDLYFSEKHKVCYYCYLAPVRS